MRLELAADYLVMAAWLAYLKSRLLLPDGNSPEAQTAEEMADRAGVPAEAPRGLPRVAQKLLDRPQLERDIFSRGDPEPISHIKHPQWSATLYDLLSAYARAASETGAGHVRFAARKVWSLAEARGAIERLIGVDDRLDLSRRLS